jgi:FAD binding domain/NAD(P)-binding Rossmann-like domain
MEVADTVIVGGGISGCAAAAFLTHFGASINAVPNIVLLESNTVLGGVIRGNIGSNGNWQPDSFEDMQDLNDFIQEADDYYAGNVTVFSDTELQALLDDDIAAIDILVKQTGAIEGFVASDLLPYYGDDTNAADRKDCYFLDADRTLVEWVTVRGICIFLQGFGGTAGRNIFAAAPKGEDGLPLIPSFVGRMCSYASSLDNVKVLMETEAKSLALNTDDQQGRKWQLTAAQTNCNNDEDLKVFADNVIFASGGFTANRAIMEQRGLQAMEPHYWNDINTGVIENVASDLGFRPCPAIQRDTLPVWYSEAVSIQGNDKLQVLLFLNGDSMFVVNRTGNRVYNEKLSYARRGKVCFENGYLLAIMDGKNLADWSTSIPLYDPLQNAWLPAQCDGNYIHGGSVEELETNLKAASIDVDADFAQNLKAQLERFNTYAANGVDEEFGRHSFDRTIENPDTPAMAPVDETDLYAVKLIPSTLDTCSGPFVDSNNQVWYESTDEPVPGVYAVGNAACSITRGLYNSPGTPTFQAFVGAYRAARSITGA